LWPTTAGTFDFKIVRSVGGHASPWPIQTGATLTFVVKKAEALAAGVHHHATPVSTNFKDDMAQKQE